MFKPKRLPVPAWLAAVAVMAAGAAFAQQGGSTVDVTKVEGLGNKAQEPRSADAQAKQAAKIEERASQICARQSAMLNNARREKDIIQATCLDDKLTQCNANLASVKARREALTKAVRANDKGRAKQESTIIGVLGQKFQILDHAASQCIGQDIFETGSTTVAMEVDPDTPREDATVTPATPVAPVPYIPPPVSGTS